MNNEKYGLFLVLKSAINLLINGATSRSGLDFNDVLECLEEIKKDYQTD